jgi:hypothetical protein
MLRVRKIIGDSPVNDAAEHEWAEYNLPLALLLGLSGDDEDKQAFLGLAMEPDAELPDDTA